MTSPSRKKRPTTPPSLKGQTPFNALVALSAAVLLGSQFAPPVHASGWRPAGSAANRAAQSAITHDAVVVQAAAQIREAGDEFDPFDDPQHGDETAATPARGSEPEFDPFEQPAAEAPTVQARPVPPRRTDRDAEYNELFEVQDAFDEPRGRSVGPSVEEVAEEELNEAREAIQDEIERREQDERDRQEQQDDEPLADDGSDPFQPGDATDRPRTDDDVSGAPDLEDEVESDIDAGEDGLDEDDFDYDNFDWRSQQAPGGYRFRPLDPQPELTPEQQVQRREQLEAERLENDETCEEFVATVKADNIRTVSLDIRLHGEAGEDYPFDCGFGPEMFQPRSWQQTTFLWKAAGLCHKPLYFEQVQMERYGHSVGPVLDPIVSGAHFFGTLPVLPYKMGLTTPNECIYTLGYYRPGSCAPYMIPAVPFTWRAAAFEGAAWTTGVLVFP